MAREAETPWIIILRLFTPVLLTFVTMVTFKTMERVDMIVVNNAKQSEAIAGLRTEVRLSGSALDARVSAHTVKLDIHEERLDAIERYVERIRAEHEQHKIRGSRNETD